MLPQRREGVAYANYNDLVDESMLKENASDEQLQTVNVSLSPGASSSRLFRKKNPQEGQEKSNSIINILCTVTPRKVNTSVTLWGSYSVGQLLCGLLFCSSIASQLKHFVV